MKPCRSWSASTASTMLSLTKRGNLCKCNNVKIILFASFTFTEIARFRSVYCGSARLFTYSIIHFYSFWILLLGQRQPPRSSHAAREVIGLTPLLIIKKAMEPSPFHCLLLLSPRYDISNIEKQLMSLLTEPSHLIPTLAETHRVFSLQHVEKI